MMKLIGGVVAIIAVAAVGYFLYQVDKQATEAIEENTSGISGVKTVPEDQSSLSATAIQTETIPAEIPDEIDDSQVENMLADVERIEARVKDDMARLSADELVREQSAKPEQALFNIVTQPEVIPAPPNMEGIIPSQWIELDATAMQTLERGSRFELPAVGKNAYQVVIADKKTLWNGDSSIKGKVYDEAGESFPLILSVGASTSYMSYSTPEGSFEAELREGKGAIYSVSEIDRITENGKYEDVIQDIRVMRKNAN
jgi:hypothetical protein